MLDNAEINVDTNKNLTDRIVKYVYASSNKKTNATKEEGENE